MAEKKQKDGDNAKMDVDKLAEVLSNILREKTPLKEKIATSDLLELKRALNPVNNMITKELTIKFIRNLNLIFQKTLGELPDEIKNKIEELVNDSDAVNVNANGYDFVKHPIVAEVKGNIPYEGNKYGASQKTGLKKDLNGLLLPPNDPKKTSKKRKFDLKNDYKFLVVLNYNRHGCDTLNSVEDFRNGYEFKENVKIIKDINDPPSLDKKHVYIVMLKL